MADHTDFDYVIDKMTIIQATVGYGNISASNNLDDRFIDRGVSTTKDILDTLLACEEIPKTNRQAFPLDNQENTKKSRYSPYVKKLRSFF